jgi:phage gpG-like protein
MIEISIALNGETQMSRGLMVGSTALKDFKAPLTAAAELLQKTFQLNFDVRGDTFGGWAPRTRDYGWPLLEKTGAMRKSFFTTVAADMAVLGNTSPYFKYHQLGTRKMPQRLMMKVDNERKALVVKIFQQHLLDSMKAFR